MRVGFQGERGAFSEYAIIQLWGGTAKPVAMRSFDDVAYAAETGRVDFGILPIESTLLGAVDLGYDLLALHERLFVVAETVVAIHLNVVGLPGATLPALRRLASHPIMLAQCAHFLDAHRHIRPQPSWDTAGAAREVRERGDPTWAAAASALAAEYLGLTTLATGIEDRPDAMMRFLAVRPEPAILTARAPVRTALLCVLPNTVGALVSVLQPLAALGFNVSHFAARPTREPWDYQFYIEFEHAAGDARAADAVASVRRACRLCRALGTYPRWQAPDQPLHEPSHQPFPG